MYFSNFPMAKPCQSHFGLTNNFTDPLSIFSQQSISNINIYLQYAKLFLSTICQKLDYEETEAFEVPVLSVAEMPCQILAKAQYFLNFINQNLKKGCVKSIKTVIFVILNEVKNPVFMRLSKFLSRSTPSG
jgi:hypothetical protein